VSEQGWNYADVWEEIAQQLPEATAQVCGDRRFTWTEFDRRADGVAAALLDAGLGHQDKVAQYLYNGPEYIESMFAAFKAGLVPVNTNYRYADDELLYLWDNADTAAIVVHADLGDRAARLRDRLPDVKLWLWVDAPDGMACPDWAVPYEEVAGASGPRRVRGPWGRSGDDLTLLYTGGTTGLPKGVMWPQHEIFQMLERTNSRVLPDPPDAVALAATNTKPGPRFLPAPPLMHGSAQWFAFPVLNRGGSIITVPDRRFDATALLDTLAAERATGVGIVGDAFARPLLDLLDAHPGRWDLSALRVVLTSGAMMSADVKRRLLLHLDNATLIDGLGTSESGGLGQSSVDRKSLEAGGAATAEFKVNESTRVVDDDGRDVVPGSGQRGRLAVAGFVPVGYYKDPEKTASTFVELDGRRHVIAGDWAEVSADGTITLLGRGSGCINTGGEKVYPEEVEEALKTHTTVVDAGVIGLPDERFGETIAAVVELVPGAALDADALREHVRSVLAGYKVPRSVVAIDTLGRLPNGKMDYPRLRAWAAGDGVAG
jgi:acyl-CoA synthetase (AMP-forming)/AMP-acid ligase II